MDQPPVQITTVIVWLTPFLIAIVGYLIKRAIDANDVETREVKNKVIEADKTVAVMQKDIELLRNLLSGLREIQSEWTSVKKDVGQVILEIQSMREMRDNVAVLKRDQTTIWQRIDEIKKERVAK